MPAADATSVVPARCPRSWAPPTTSAVGTMRCEHTSAPVPRGPWNLWAESESRSKPSRVKSMGRWPAACTASVWKSAPRLRTARQMSRTGSTAPTSLFAYMMETRHVSSRRAAFTAETLTTPSASGRTRVTSKPPPKGPSGEARRSSILRMLGCSMAEATMWRLPALAPKAAPVSRAWLFASEPPEVSSTSRGWAWRHAAMRARASSSARSAASPAACWLIGLANAGPS